MHPFQHRVIERLRADRQAIDAGVAPRRDRVSVTSSGLASSVTSASVASVMRRANRVEQPGDAVAAEP